MRILKFKMFESVIEEFKIEWSLEDISGDCSPSGSTTIDSNEVLFNNISDKYNIIEEIIDESGMNNSIKCKLYATLFKKDGNGEWTFVEDIDI